MESFITSDFHWFN